jgi:MATE family, multidrug efflux pump
LPLLEKCGLKDLNLHFPTHKFKPEGSMPSNGPDKSIPKSKPPGATHAGMDLTDDDVPEIASPLLDLRDKSSTPLAPSPRSLGIWELAWPTMLAAAMQTIVRWADIKMVGDLGVEAVAGVAAGGQIYWLVQAASMALTTGLVALIARAIGSGDTDLADRVLKQTILMGAVFGLFSWIVMIPFLDDSMILLGVAPGVVDHGSSYLFWLIAGNVPFALGFIFAAALRAAGDSRIPLYVGLVTNVINIILNWLLIYGHWGFPELGVVGAGMASSLAMVAQLIIFWALWSKRTLIVVPGPASFRFDKTLAKRILKIGYPATIEGVIWQVGLLAFMAILSGYGTAEFTAYQIGVQVLALAFLPGHGFAMAASTVVGQNLGAADPDKAAQAGWHSARLSFIFMSLLGIALIIVAEPFARWFLDDDAVVALAVDFIWVLALCQPFMSVEFAIGGALRGAGDTRFPMLVSFVGLFLCRLLPAAIAAFVFKASIQIVWSVLLLDWSVKAAMLAWRFYGGKWKHVKV